MSTPMTSLQDTLRSFDNTTEPFAEYEIAQAIRETAPPGNTDPPLQVTAELIAFELYENYQGDLGNWGTYYGPMSVSVSKDGDVYEYPSIDSITSEVIDYWAERVTEVAHPILKARYADLVWVFSNIVKKEKPSIRMAQVAIESSIEIARRRLRRYELSTVDHLTRALTLSSSISDQTRYKQTRDAIIDYEERIGQDEKLGTWGFSFDLLIRSRSRRFPLPTSMETRIIAALEARLARLTSQSASSLTDPQLFGAEKAALALASFYQQTAKADDLNRVVRLYYKSFKSLVDGNEAGLASMWLRRMLEVFNKYGLSDEADEVSIALRDIGPSASAELKSLSVDSTFSVESLQEYASAIVSGNLEEALINIALSLTPPRKVVEENLRQLEQEFPLFFRIPKEVMDANGLTVGTVGSLDTDLSGNIIFQMAEQLSLESPLLRLVMTTLVEKFNVTDQELVDHLYLSPLYSKDMRLIVEKGIRAYLQNDYITSIHMLIPQIEVGIRRLFELARYPVLVRGRKGAVRFRLLDNLLRDEDAQEILSSDLVWYFRTLLTDQRGWNLRNTVSHGLMRQQDLGPDKADRVVHALLCLAMVRYQTTD